MSEILNKYKRWKPILLLNKEKYLDFVLSLDNSTTIELDGNLTEKCLISYIDTNNPECFGEDGILMSTKKYSYENYINDGSELLDFGFNGTDNGRILYDKDNITLKEFVDILTGTTLNVTSGDTRLYLYPVDGNSKYYQYPLEIVEEESGDTYYAMKGGFLQGFYKLDGFDYQVLPKDIYDCWNLEFVIRPRTDYEMSGTTSLNSEHPENNGIFFYMGTRSENKFGRFYGEDLSKYPDRESYSGTCFDVCEHNKDNSKSLLDRNFLWSFLSTDDMCGCYAYTCNECVNINYDIDPFISGLSLCEIDLSTSEGHKLDSNKYFEITTDNKYIIFDRTKDGYTTDTWDDENLLSLVQKKMVNHENLFTLMYRGKGGYTTQTIQNYFDSLTGQTDDYSILTDIKDNAFALKVNEDNSIGYRYLIKDCDVESGYTVINEHTFANIINPDEWNVVNVMCKILDGNTDKCGNSLGNRKMRIFIYVNGYLKLVSKELPEFRFRELNDYYDKQEGVPFNISLGGGTQGLAESMWVDNYKHPYCKVLPIEENFGGSFIGDIRSFKFYNCQMQYNEIKNNYLYEMGGLKQ